MTLRVAAFVPHPPAGASSRFRVYDLVEPLAALGIEVEVLPFLDPAGYDGLYRGGAVFSKAAAMARGGFRRWRDLARARADVALIHREIWPMVGSAAIARLRRCHPRWVFDFDDAVWIPNVSDANRAFARLKPFDQPGHLVDGAAAVSAGNAWLADWALARRVGRSAEDVAVVPTTVDTRRWSPRVRPAGPPRLVWIGTHSTAAYLEPWMPAITRLARRHPGLELHLIGATLQAPGVRVVSHEWSHDNEVEQVAAGDIGLAPLPESPWAKGKCGSKLLLYMALGLPAVASAVGVHSEIVRDGRDGILALTPEDAENAIDRLLKDPALRAHVGGSARERVEDGYSIAVAVPRLAALLHRAAGASP